MRTNETSLLLALCTACVVVGIPSLHAQTPQTSSSATARVIVQFKVDSPLIAEKAIPTAPGERTRAKALGMRVGMPMDDGPPISSRAQVVLSQGMTSEQLAARLSQESDVEYAVPDLRRHISIAPDDPLYLGGGTNGPASGQWYLRAPAGDVQSSLNVERAWEITTGSPSIVVAVVDTGVRYEHPDLLAVAAGGNLLPGYDMVSDLRQANDGDGRDADASDPGDWVTQAELSQRGSPLFQCRDAPENSSWHGTQVSGLIAALTDNGIGMASVGRHVHILPIRALGKCGGFDSDIIAAMNWAAGFPVPGVPANPNPARVINLSLGAPSACGAAYQQAVSQIVAAGVVIVAAAGNDAGHAVSSPANCDGVIAVAALRHVGTKVGFSDLGPNVSIAAPGGNCVNTAAGAPCLYPIVTTSDAGTTVPAGSIWTDGLNHLSLGTSFASPLVAGTVALMLSANPSLTPSQVKAALQSTARPFPTTGGDNGDGTVVPQCAAPQVDATGNPIDQLQCYCTTSTCGAGMVDAGAAVMAAAAASSARGLEIEGLWWAAPAGSESGWGLNIAQQGDVIFATWFTYDVAGKAWWLSMTGTKTADNFYSGTLYQTRGPAFNAVPFNPANVVATPVGTGTLAFTAANAGTFSYTVNGVTQSKAITPQVFGALPVCTFGVQSNLKLAGNYQDLWWAAPAGVESGWGVNIIEQSNIIFATWFTYDVDGAPLWLSVTATNASSGVYSGTLYRATGPAFNAVPFDPSAVHLTAVGSATFTFTDGNDATFAYTVNGVSQAKSITRQIFSAPGTVCQ